MLTICNFEQHTLWAFSYTLQFEYICLPFFCLMKKIFTLSLTLAITFQLAAQGYKVSFKTKSYTSGIAYLAYHMGKNYNIADSAAVGANGVAIFSGTKSLVPGIYAIAYPNRTLTADFLIDKDQEISVKADTSDYYGMVVTGSSANLLFETYQKYVMTKGQQMQNERAAYNAAQTKEDSLIHEKKYNEYNEELNNFRNDLVKNNPESMMAVLLSAMKDAEVPNKKPVTSKDSMDNYYYYKAHYWDGITFMDERVIRTPFFQPKLERYYREIVPQASDSIIKDLDYKLLLARSAPEMYKFLLNWFTDEYINPKYMGQDAVFVHLFNKYHSKGLSPWLNEKQMETISRRAYMQMSNLIGETAANLQLVDSMGKVQTLYDQKAEFTVVVFWDPNCGHCKQEIPRIDSIYQATWKKQSVKIYAVNTENDKTAWVNYIKEHKLNGWVNVYQTKKMQDEEKQSQAPSYKQLFDVIQTPTLYLLDKDKRIIGKKLTWQQLNDLMQVKMKNKK